MTKKTATTPGSKKTPTPPKTKAIKKAHQKSQTPKLRPNTFASLTPKAGPTH